MSRFVRVATIAVALSLAGRVHPAIAGGAPAWDAHLGGNEDTKHPFVLEGRVLGEDGRPLRGVRVHAYHAGEDGRYMTDNGHNYRHSGMLRTDGLGRYRLHTSLPGIAEGSPHVHFEVELPGGEVRAIPVHLARSHGAGSDRAFERFPWMVKLDDRAFWTYVEPAEGRGYEAHFDVQLMRASRIPRPAVFGAK